MWWKQNYNQIWILNTKTQEIKFKCLNYSDACDVGIDWVEIGFSDAMDQNKPLGMKCDWY